MRNNVMMAQTGQHHGTLSQESKYCFNVTQKSDPNISFKGSNKTKLKVLCNCESHVFDQDLQCNVTVLGKKKKKNTGMRMSLSLSTSPRKLRCVATSENYELHYNLIHS